MSEIPKSTLILNLRASLLQLKCFNDFESSVGEILMKSHIKNIFLLADVLPSGNTWTGIRGDGLQSTLSYEVKTIKGEKVKTISFAENDMVLTIKRIQNQVGFNVYGNNPDTRSLISNASDFLVQIVNS